MRGWWWLILSVVVAAAVSYLALPSQRNAAVGSIAKRVEERRPKTPSDEDVEDAAVAATGAGDPAGGESARDGRGATPPEAEREPDSDHEFEGAEGDEDSDEVLAADAAGDDAMDGHSDRNGRDNQQRS